MSAQAVVVSMPHQPSENASADLHYPAPIETEPGSSQKSETALNVNNGSANCGSEKNVLHPQDISYILKTALHPAKDLDWTNGMHDRLCIEASAAHAEGRRIPIIEKTKFPDMFNEDSLAKQKILYVFRDTTCLADGQKWEGDGTRDGGGFIGAILRSIVFVPVLSSFLDKNEMRHGSVGQLRNLSENGAQDNVLVELVVAKFLYQCSQKAGKAMLFPCSVILPFVLCDDVFIVAKELPKHISIATNTKAYNTLKAAGYNPPLEMIDSQYLDFEKKHHPWSIFEVVKFILEFQGVLTYKCGSDRRDVKECADRTLAAVAKKFSTCDASTLMFETNNPLARELREFIESKFMIHYMCCLDSHGVKSIRALSQLDDYCTKEISSQMAHILNSSKVEQFCKLKQLVSDAKEEEKAQTLRVRLDSFFDQNASWSTAITSTCAVDLLMRQKLYLFIMIVGPFIMTAVGLYLLFFPVTYTRKFGDKTESLTHRSISTVVLLFGCAIGLGPICIVCSYLGSPRKGRYALAYSTYLLAFIIQAAGFYFDGANIDFCRFNSLEPNESSISNCVIAYAIAFGFRELFFLVMFFVTLKRQELYWDGFSFGISIVLGCNFIIYGLARLSVENTFVTAAIICAVLSLNMLVRFKRKQSHLAAQQTISKDTQRYEKCWEEVLRTDGTGTLLLNDDDLKLTWMSQSSPVENANTKHQIRQDSNDFEDLFCLAEIVNGPFNDMITRWCTQGQDNSSGPFENQVFNLMHRGLFQNETKVIPGPIKSVQRAIEKVYRCYRSDASLLTDLVRCQVVFSSFGDIEIFIRKLIEAEQRCLFDILRVRNRFNRSYPVKQSGGYAKNDVHINYIISCFSILIDSTVAQTKCANTGRFRDCCIKLKVYFKVNSSTGIAEFCSKKKDKVGNLKTLSLICEVQLHIERIYKLLQDNSEMHENYIAYRNQMSN